MPEHETSGSAADDMLTRRADEIPPRRELAAGERVFGRYRLKAQAGRGGMGVVWRARDETLEADVALKFLPEIVAHDPAAVNDLKRETRRSLQLTHPNIVRIFDFVQVGPAAAISMEYVEGSTLTQRRLNHSNQVFEPDDLRKWARQLCEALDYAHTKAKVVHRDLKPSNLMIDAQGELKVTDFGISATLTDSTARVSTVVGSSGTLAYMSPQQMMGEKPVPTDDIYSLGATLYELLTSKPPFHSGRIEMQVMQKILPSIAQRRQELGVTGERIPPVWEQTILACLAKEAQDRPQSAGEVAERLGLATKDQPSPRLRPTGTKSIKTDDRKVGRVTALAAAVLVLAGAGYYFGVYAPEQQRLAAEQTRLAEIRRLEMQARAEVDAQERARLEADALKLKNEQERVTAEAKGKAEQERLAAEHLANARGGLVVRTNPSGAEVRVGAIALEKSPLTLKDQKLGKYPVKVRLDGYEDWSGEIEVKENDFTDLNVTLIRSTGTVALTSEPSGLDAELVGRVIPNTPPPAGRQSVRTPGSVKLPTGSYDVTFRQPGWPEQKQTVEITRNQSVTASTEFAGGGLELTSSPAGAEVWQNGRRVGATPYQALDTMPGRYDFELKLKGYKPTTAGLTVTARQTARESVALEKHRFPQPGRPYENTLGQKFVPVPGTGGLFCIWETRVQDYQAFIQATRREWSKAGFAQGPTHPAVNVSWDDAQAFCAWLTKNEQADGRLGPGQKYRLPTDAEWSVAVGLNESTRGTPQSKDLRIKGVYPWGTQWPPPRGAGNYAPSLNVDVFANTSPVGSFAANKFGLHDMGGNVWQWCEDFYNASNVHRVLRGVTFAADDPGNLLSSSRPFVAPNFRNDLIGFRCVVVVASGR